MPFQIIRHDITRVPADVIVNTANPDPIIGRGTDAAIYSAAGYERLLKERMKIGKIGVGEVSVTEAFDLPAKYIIHTVGPVWQGGDHGEYEALSSCYRKSLLLAKQLGCESIAFPLISSGNYHFPKDKALETALREIRSFLDENDMSVTLVVFDKRTYELSAELMDGIRTFIDEKYVEFHPKLSASVSEMQTQSIPMPEAKKKQRKLHDLKRKVGENYQECLFRLIDERGLTDAEVYKRANIDRRLFSKIRSNPEYHPKKQTAIALAMALELNMDETIDLIGRAGIALSDASLFDLIIQYCIENRIYDLFTVNSILFDNDQILLGG